MYTKYFSCLKCRLPFDFEEPHYGQHLSCFEGLFGVSGRVEFESLARQSVISADEAKAIVAQPHLTSYFSGHYRKYEGKLAGASYILKMSKDDYPELAPVEYLCNQIADLCGIAIARPFALIDYLGEYTYVSKNFMEGHVAHASLQHIYHFLKPGPEHYNVEEINKAIFQETHSVQDVETFLRLLLFDALVGNHDRHGRNLALIVTARSRRLAPIYDSPSALGLESGSILRASFAPKGKIWTRDSREPEMAEYLQEIERLGMTDVIDDFRRRIEMPTLLKFIAESPALSPGMREAMARLVKGRYEALNDYAARR